MQRFLVTGAQGFIGWNLVEALVKRGDGVRAWTRSGAGGWSGTVESAVVDMTDGDAVARDLADFVPDIVVHLCARSLVGPSWEDPALTYRINVLGSIHLLEAARSLSCPPRVLLAGSSAEYAEPVDDALIGEDAPLEPNSPYGTSKLAVDEFARLSGRRYDSDIVRFRPFFLAGPRKTGDVCSDFARRVVAIERGQAKVMQVGNLAVIRDMMDVRDGVAGLLRIADSGKSGEVYNICSGKGVSIGEILETYRRMAQAPFLIETDSTLLRPLDQKSKIGNPAKLQGLGWKPEIHLEETLAGILDYWRHQPG